MLMTGVLFINGVITFCITGIQVDGLFMFSLARGVDACVRPYGLNTLARYACHTLRGQWNSGHVYHGVHAHGWGT